MKEPKMGWQKKEPKEREYRFVTKSTVCTQCEKKFKYESKVYGTNGKQIKERSVCDECKRRSAMLKAREAREEKKKGGR